MYVCMYVIHTRGWSLKAFWRSGKKSVQNLATWLAHSQTPVYMHVCMYVMYLSVHR